MSVVAVGLIAPVTWMLFLVSGFRWLGDLWSKWLAELLLSLRAGLTILGKNADDKQRDATSRTETALRSMQGQFRSHSPPIGV